VIEVESVELVPFSSIDDADARLAGEADPESSASGRPTP
jgi:hypothetical protein